MSEGSYIEFYKNGVLQERKFIDIFEGTYHAAVSVYMHARCKVNFGKCPFAFQPNSQTESTRTWLPYSMLSAIEFTQSTHPNNLPAQSDLPDFQCSESVDFQEKRIGKSK